MITLYKKNSSLLSVISLILLVSIVPTGLIACKASDSPNSKTNINSSIQATADIDSTSPDDSGSATAGSDGNKNGQHPDNENSMKADTRKNQITYDDQIKVEESIKAFGKAIENGDYNTAEEYCAPDFKEYMVNLTGGNGAITDIFSMAIVEKMPIKLVLIKGYYDEGEKGLNYNITKDRPTIHFRVSFEIRKPNGQKDSADAYTQGVKGIDGKWHIEGFASGR